MYVRRFFLWSGCGLLLLIFISATYGYSSRAGILATAMQTAGVTVQEVSFDAWTQLPSGEYDQGKLTSLAEQLLCDLGIAPAGAQMSWSEGMRHKALRVVVAEERREAVVVVQELWQQQDGSREVHMAVHLQMTAAEMTVLPEQEEQLAAALKKIGAKPHITTCLVGWHDGKLVDGQWDEKLNQAFQIISAIPSGRMSGDGYTGLSGYTPEIGDSLVVGDKRVNVHMAVRYSPYYDRTYLTVGSPIITREY